MISNNLNIPSLLDLAREAAGKQDFESAALLYDEILKEPSMQGKVDIKVKYAFCLEKLGKYFESIKYYQEVINSNPDVQDSVAIRTLESKVSILRSFLRSANARKPKARKNKQSFTRQINESATQEFEDYLALGTKDLSTQEVPSKPRGHKKMSEYALMEALALETQDMMPFEGENKGTLDLSKSEHQ